MNDGAGVISDFANDHPHLASLSITAVKLTLSGPVGFAREQVLDVVGINDSIDKVATKAENYFSEVLQDQLGFEESYANLTAGGARFGAVIGLGIVGAASKDKIIDTAKDVTNKIKVYVTYTKLHPVKSTYSGRTSGLVTDIEDRKQLQNLVARRDHSHQMNKEGYRPAELDKASVRPEAIRGREQTLINNNGGAQSTGGISGNKNNGIASNNPRKPIYEAADKQEFGQ